VEVVVALSARCRTAAVQRRTRAVELAGRGYSYEQIANAVGYAHRASAYRAVRQELDRVPAEAVDEYRRIVLERLGMLQAAVWEKAMKGEESAVNSALKVIQLQVRLLGLDRPERMAKADVPTVVVPIEDLEYWVDDPIEANAVLDEPELSHESQAEIE
jgi:hypothetical protein